MAAARIPENETERLATLYALALLDTEAEAPFDHITRMARRLFDLPIALVSLIDDDRQWFKSRQGLPGTETPRSDAFCAHAILEAETFVVEDATEDERFAANALVVGDPNIRFYAGAQVSAPNGAVLGTVCVIDDRPRQFGEEDAEALRDLADMVNREIAVRFAGITDELTGLYNRRGFVAAATHLIARADRRREPVAAVFADLDGLKAINDRCGHAAGDEAIARAAAVLRLAFRRSAPVARLGGDEFAVLLCGQEAAEVGDALVRLESLVLAEASSTSQVSDEQYRFAISAGAALRTDGQSLADLVEVADASMYTIKSERRAAARTSSWLD